MFKKIYSNVLLQNKSFTFEMVTIIIENTNKSVGAQINVLIEPVSCKQNQNTISYYRKVSIDDDNFE